MDHQDAFLRFVQQLGSLHLEKKLTPDVAIRLLSDISSNSTTGNFCSGQEGAANAPNEACGGAGAQPSSSSKEGEARTDS